MSAVNPVLHEAKVIYPLTAFPGILLLGEMFISCNISASQERICIQGKMVCIANDISSAVVNCCAYQTPAFPIPGSGKIIIEKLNADQIAKKVLSLGEPLLLVGTLFDAVFEVTMAAKNPAGVQDPLPKYTGKGFFLNKKDPNHKYLMEEI